MKKPTRYYTHMIVDNALFTIRDEIERIYGERHEHCFKHDCYGCKAHKLLDKVEKAIDFQEIEDHD